MKKFSIVYIAMIFIFFSCDKYLDINDNPNGAISPPIAGLLSNVTYNSAINVYRVGYTTSYFVQYNASPNSGGSSDTHQRINTDGIWTNIYNISGDISDLIKFGKEQESNHYVGIGKILMALNMGMVVDLYGDVPYSQAFNFETITPQYDKDVDMYDRIISLLNEGINDLERDNEGVALKSSNDFIHRGNVRAWIKTAYALKARYLNHLSKTDKDDVSAILDAVNQSYASNSDDAQLTIFKTRNPWNQVALNNDNLELDGWLSSNIINAMNGETYGVFDPRLPHITRPLPDGSFVGTPNGAGRKGSGSIQEETYLTQDGYYSSINSPLTIITYSELKFIEAEAYLRAGNDNEAYIAYLEGIRANMEKIGVDDSEINDYVNNPAITVGQSNITNKLIFKEKYVAMFLNPESWVDVRRNDYNYDGFIIPNGLNSDLGGKFSRRFDYPDTEQQRNSDNLPSLTLLDRIFWDVP